MTEKRAEPADKLSVDDIDGGMGFVADEDGFDRRRLLWRLTSWGVTAIGAVTIAILANQSSITLRREQTATADLARQTQQIQALARQNHIEAGRLASAIEALSGDRDRLDTRVAALEQGLDSVTGSIARRAKEQQQKDMPLASPANAAASAPSAASGLPHHAAAPPSAPSPAQVATPSAPAIAAPVVAATETPYAADVPSPDPGTKKSEAPDAAVPAATSETKVMASTQPAPTDAEPAMSTTPDIPVQRTEFGVDLGSANSIDGLRALWRNVLRLHSKDVGSLEPIIAIREHTNGRGMRLHLVAGPLSDAAAAAKICAALTDRKRTCETSVYDGQRLALRDSTKPAGDAMAVKPQTTQRVVLRHKRNSRLTRIEHPASPPLPPEPHPARSGLLFFR